MPPFGPIKKKDLVRYFAKLGFDGPYSGGKHQFMIKGHITIRIPNPHKTDISIDIDANGNIVNMTVEHAKDNAGLWEFSYQEMFRQTA